MAQPAPASARGPAHAPARPQRDTGEEWGARCVGALLWGGQGSLPSLSLLRAVPVPGQGPTRSLQTPRGRGTPPRARLCQGLRLRWERPGKADSSDLNHAGRRLVRRHRLSHRCRHRAGHGGLPWPARLGVTGAAGGPHTAPGWDLAASPFPCTAGTPRPASPQHWSGARVMLAKWGAVPLPPPFPAHPRLGDGGPHGTASPRAGAGGGGRAGGGSPRCCGEWVSGRAPRPPKASRTPGWPVLGVSAGAVLALRDGAGVTQGPGAPRPRQPRYQPPDSHCRAMAASQPQTGKGGAALRHRGWPLSPGPLYSPFFFPLPSGKQYLSAYIMLASPERPAASAADLSPLLRAVPGGVGGSECRSRAQGPSGSHTVWPGPSPAPAPAAAWEHAAPAPRGAPGWGPCAGSSVASRGASHCPPQAAAPVDGDPHPAEPGCLHRPGHADHGHLLSRCSPSLRPPWLPSPSCGPTALPALPPPQLTPSSRWVAWPPARSPAPSMGHAAAGDWAAPSHGANLLPLPVVLPRAGAGGLPTPLPSLRCLRGPLLVQAGWVPQGRGAGRDGERVLLCASVQGSGDGCCGHTCTHPRLCRVSVGVTRTPHMRDGTGCRGLCWTRTSPVTVPIGPGRTGPLPRALGSPVPPLGRECQMGPRLLPWVPARGSRSSSPDGSTMGCPRGVPGWERRGLEKPNWAVGWGSPTVGLGHWDVPLPCRCRAVSRN